MQTMTRRGALITSATGAITALLAGTTAGSASAATKPSRADWTKFARGVRGPLYLPGSSGYGSSKLLFDTHYDGSTPAAVFGVKSTSDVVAAMKFASDHGLQVSARAGGHSYVGASAASGTLVLDLRALRSFRYAADHTVRVDSGLGLYDVKRQLADRGRAIPTGTCPTVGAAGLTLGGGLGVESREYGITADRLTAARLVLPDGKVVSVDARHEPDIFWALRGGGGGNIGVLLDLTFATHPARRQGIFELTFAGRSAADVIAGWSKWSVHAPRDQWAQVHVTSDGRGGVGALVVGVTTAGAERSAARSLIAAVGHRPAAASYRELSYLSAAVFLGGGTTSTRQGFAGGSDVLGRIDESAASAVVDAVAQQSRARRSGTALLDPLTGAVSDPAADATTFPWRNHAASVQWYVGVGRASGYRSAYDWIDAAHRRVGHWSSGSYVNYPEQGRAAGHYYAGNLERLATIRHRYDPARVVHSGVRV